MLDTAFKELEGDDKKYAAAVRKRNKAEAKGQGVLVFGEPSNTSLAAEREQVLTLVDDVDQVRGQARRWQVLENSADYRTRKIHADAWCAAFVWPLHPGAPEPPTNAVLTALGENPADPHLASVVTETERVAQDYRFFHWHLEFPEVFHVDRDPAVASAGPEGWTGGFSCLLGNPPWERVKLQEQEFFAGRAPDIATAPNKAARDRKIKALATSGNPIDRALHAEYLAAKRQAEGQSAILRTSDRYPLAGRGDVNTYAVFAEAFRSLTGPHGRSGVIVPTGIATDATTQYFFKDLVENGSLAALYDFENRAGLFPAVDSRMKFCLLTMAGRAERETAASFAFFLHDPELIGVSEFSLTPEEITLLNPNTGTCPVFRTRRDAELALHAARLARPLRAGSHNPYNLVIRRNFDMGNQETHSIVTFGSVAKSSDLPMYESKLFHSYDHRFATYTADKGQVVNVPQYAKEAPDGSVRTRYLIPAVHVRDRLSRFWDQKWLLAWRDIARNTDERSLIAAILPLAGTDFTLRIGLPQSCPVNSCVLLLTAFNSMCVDYLMRQRLGGTHISDYIIEQLPSFTADDYSNPSPWQANILIESWLRERAIELTYTEWSLRDFAQDLDFPGPPFRWSDERRELLRVEIDAAFFHLYRFSRDDVDYILDTFPIVRRKDEERYGEYRTKRLILEVYDAMQRAIDTGEPYQTILDPPPGQGPRHPDRSEAAA
ncbi:MAG: hypothetical protein ACYCPF_03975 [Streptosporangiaceae bacterium]